MNLIFLRSAPGMMRRTATAVIIATAVAAAGVFGSGVGCIEAKLTEGRYSCDPEFPDRCPPGWSCSWCAVRGEYRCFKGSHNHDFDGDGGVPEYDAGPDAAPNPERCGNDVCERDEECDGPDLKGRNCVSVGHSGGTLLCDQDCGFDTTGCFDCGNQVCESWKGEDDLNCPDDCP